MGEEETNLLYKRISNNLFRFRYSALKEMEHNPQLFKCELCLVTFFQRAQHGNREKE